MDGYQYKGYWIVMCNDPVAPSHWHIHYEPDDQDPVYGLGFESALGAENFIDHAEEYMEIEPW